VAPVVLSPLRALAIILCVAGVVGAGKPADRSGPARPTAAGRATNVLGAAWDVNSKPLPQARLRLRNLATGRIEATTVSDQAGQFTFTHLEGETYVIELVDESGKVLAVGHPFVVAPGETVATFVRLSARVPWYSGFFRDAAASAISTAAGEGITALAPVARPVSAKR
jgi:hypothetical protein